MTSALFREAARAFRAALAREMGCAPEAYESHALTVVERPSNSREPHLALATTCGTGSVLSVRDRELAAWALKEELAHHFRIFLPSFLEGLAAEARELGHANAKSHTASTGMVLAEAVDPGTLPPGYSVRDLSVDEQERLRAGKAFDNALLEPAEKKVEYFRTAFAAFDPGGEVAAVAGVWDQYPGIDEIGLDVVRQRRGLGLGRAMTVHAARWVRSRERWPIYTYGFTNIRSANTGLAAGFRPLWQIAAVYRPQDVE